MAAWHHLQEIFKHYLEYHWKKKSYSTNFLLDFNTFFKNKILSINVMKWPETLTFTYLSIKNILISINSVDHQTLEVTTENEKLFTNFFSSFLSFILSHQYDFKRC